MAADHDGHLQSPAAVGRAVRHRGGVGRVGLGADGGGGLRLPALCRRRRAARPASSGRRRWRRTTPATVSRIAAGSLGFIIESGIRRAAAEPEADIATRVAAYLELLGRFLEPGALRDRTVAAVEATRRQTAPAFVPVNTFWGRLSLEPETVRVVSAETGATVEVASANVMTDRVVKRSVATPVGYVVDSADARLYRSLLVRHGIRSELRSVARTLAVESCTLERIESFVDEVYNRYEGRQIVHCSEAAERSSSPPARWSSASTSRNGGRRWRCSSRCSSTGCTSSTSCERRSPRMGRFRSTASWSQ